MKNLYLTLLASTLFTLSINAQEAPKIKFEKVSQQELAMTTYPNDTSAIAAILYDEGSSAIRYNDGTGFIQYYSRFVRIKILKTEGVDWANFEIPLYAYNGVEDKLATLKATTFNLEGGKVVQSELSKESIFRERQNKYWNTLRFAMPAVKVGSIIDVQYKITTSRIWELLPWKFQYTIPVKWSQYNVSYPEYYNYNHTTLGYYPVHKADLGATRETVTVTQKRELDASFDHQPMLSVSTANYISNSFCYSAADIPAMKDEPYLTALDNYCTQVKFELNNYNFTSIGGDFKNFTTTWNDLAQLLNTDSDFGVAMKFSGFAKEKIDELTASATTDEQKMVNIYTHLQLQMTWNEYNRLFTSQSLKVSYEKKNGNSADINLMLVAWLREAGLNANPVILSTRSNGLISPHRPSLSDCNYVIAQVVIEGKKFLLDATDQTLQPGILPFRCLNGEGIMMAGEVAEPVSLTNPKSAKSCMAQIEMRDGNLTGTIQTRLIGHSAYEFRKAIKAAGGKDEYFEEAKSLDPDLEYKNYQYFSLDSLQQPVKASYAVTLPGSGEKDADVIYLDPVLTKSVKENPFTSPSREYPVDYGNPFQESYNMIFNIPEGYKVEELPKNIMLKLPEDGGSFQYQIAQSGDVIRLTMRFSIDKPLFLPQEYESLKNYYDLVSNKQAEQIVLRKIAL